MAKPINIKEHNNAFLKFAFFFIVTLGMGIGAIYYNFRIPQKELAILRVRAESYRLQQINQEKYKRSLSEIIDILDRSDSSFSKMMIEGDVKPKIEELRNVSVIEDSSATKQLHQTIIRMVNQFLRAKLSLYDLKDANKAIDDKQREINDLTRQLHTCSEQLKNQSAQYGN